MQKRSRIAFIVISLTGFMILQSVLIWSTHSALADYREPLLGWSTHSMIADTDVDAAMDGNLLTCWSDTGRLEADRRKPPQPEPYEGLYLMVSPGMTHRPGSIPAPDTITGVQIFSGPVPEQRPLRIRLSYFEQQLYQINHDYKFPDPPVFVLSQDVQLQNTSDGQFIALKLPPILPSRGFPENVKQRWFRIEIVDLYAGSKGSICEVVFTHENTRVDRP